MSKTDIPRLRSLLGQATPRPWRIETVEGCASFYGSMDGATEIGYLSGMVTTDPDDPYEENRMNGALIAEGISALGALLDVAEAAQALADFWNADTSIPATMEEASAVEQALLAAVGRLDQQ